MNKKIAAFFDIDGTIARETLIVRHFKKLLDYGIIEQSVWYDKIRPFQDAYSKRYNDYDYYFLALADAYRESITGFNSVFNQFISQQVVEEIGEIVYKYTRSRINFHKNEDHYIFFISGSPNFLVREMALKYEVTEYKGSEYKIDENNNYNGEIEPMWQSRKKKMEVLNFAEKYNVDLSKSYSYGDTSGDVSMLKLTGNSIAINPTKELVNIIKEDEELKKRAQIIVERKDVIYSLDSSVNILDI